MVAYNLNQAKTIHQLVQNLAGQAVEITQMLLCEYSQLHPKEIEVECDKQPVENICFTGLKRNLLVLYEPNTNYNEIEKEKKSLPV